MIGRLEARYDTVVRWLHVYATLHGVLLASTVCVSDAPSSIFSAYTRVFNAG